MRAAEQFLGHVAEVAVLAVGLPEILIGSAGGLGDRTSEVGSADTERALVMAGEGARGEKTGGEGGVGCAQRFEVVADEAQLFQFFCGGAHGVGGLDEFSHMWLKPGSSVVRPYKSDKARRRTWSTRSCASRCDCDLHRLTLRTPERGARFEALLVRFDGRSASPAWLTAPSIDPQALVAAGAARGAAKSSVSGDLVAGILRDVGEEEFSSRGDQAI